MASNSSSGATDTVMAGAHRSQAVVTSAVDEALRELGSCFPLLVVELGLSEAEFNRYSLLKGILDGFRLSWGILFTIKSLARIAESEGQRIEEPSKYHYIECCRKLARLIRTHVPFREDQHPHDEARDLHDIFSIVDSLVISSSRICHQPPELEAIHQGLQPSYGESGNNGNRPHVLATIWAIEELRTAFSASSSKTMTFSVAETPLGVSPLVSTITAYLQVLNSDEDSESLLGFTAEYYRVEARNVSNPMYRIAALEWPKYGDQYWDALQEDIERLVSPSASFNFMHWALEFARMTFPEYHRVGGRKFAIDTNVALINQLQTYTMTPLHFAALLGLYELCESLVERGAIVNIECSFGSPFYCALLGRPVLILQRRLESWAFILNVMETAKPSVLRYLLRYGANCEEWFWYGGENRFVASVAGLAFVAALRYQDHEIFLQVMERGARLRFDFVELLSCPEIRQIPHESRYIMSRLLSTALDYQFEVEGDDFPWDGSNRIGNAILEIVERNLLPLDQTTFMRLPFVRDQDFENTIRQCVLNGHADYFQRLTMDDRFDPNMSAVAGSIKDGTIAHLVVGAMQHEMVAMLDPTRVDMEAVDERGRTPYMMVEDVVTLEVLILRLAVDTTAVDKDGRNLWHYAAATNDINTIECLCDHDPDKGININAVSKTGRTPFIEALKYIDSLRELEKKSIAANPHVAYRLLQEVSVDCNAGYPEIPIMHLAVQWGEDELVAMMVLAGANPKAVDPETGRTALHHLNSSASPALVDRLMRSCEGLPLAALDGRVPLQTIYDNSYPTVSESRALSDHPSCHRPIEIGSLGRLFTPELIGHHNGAGEGLWALYCESARDMMHRVGLVGGRIPHHVEHSFLTGMICLNNNGLIEAHGRETGMAAVLCFAIHEFNDNIRWSLRVNPLISHILGPCSIRDHVRMAEFYGTPEATYLMIEALECGNVKIVSFLAGKMQLATPVAKLVGRSILEHAMTLGPGEQLKACGRLFKKADMGQIAYVSQQLCLLLLDEHTRCKEEKADFLLMRGLSVNAQIYLPETRKDTCILAEAVERQYTELVRFLLERGANPGLGAITVAISKNDTSMLSTLLTRLNEHRYSWDFGFKFRGIDGYTSIDLAIYMCAHESLDMLFSRTRIRNIMNKRSNVNQGSPVIYAARQGCLECIGLLQKYDANFALTDNMGQTALHIVCARSTDMKLIDTVARLCPIQTKDHDGNTAQDLAKLHGNDEAAELIDEIVASECAIEDDSECVIEDVSECAIEDVSERAVEDDSA